MDGFHRLLRLNDAAERCWGLARTIVASYGKPQLFADDASLATKQASHRRKRAQRLIERLETAINDWSEYDDALDYVREGCGATQPILIFRDGSYQTAFELAQVFAEIVAERFYDTDGSNDASWLSEFCTNNSEFTVLPDIWSRLEAEYWGAHIIAPIDPDLTIVDQRNKFCFDQWEIGRSFKEINSQLRSHRDWEAYEDPRSVRRAIEAWAKKTGQTPRTGRPGRRPNS